MESYQSTPKNQRLLPSRLILHQDLDINFESLKDFGISHLGALKRTISTSQKLSAFSKQSGITVEYLTILKREICGLQPKIVSLKEFPNLDSEILDGLENESIKTSKYSFGCYNPEMYQNLKNLYALCDLVRINGVAPVAARCFYDAGYPSVAAIGNATATDLLEKVSR